MTLSDAPERCQACGHPGSDGDPLVFAAGYWVHESHTDDPASGFHRELVSAASDMGVDPLDLRAFLDAADFTPPTPDQTDDLPKLLARLNGGAR